MHVCMAYVYLHVFIYSSGASLMAQIVKSLPAIWETWVWSLGQKDPLEKEVATPSSILAWRIPWTEEPVHGVARVGHDLATKPPIGYSWLLGYKLTDHICMGLFPGSLFCSIDQCVCFHTSTYCFDHDCFVM